MPALDVCQVLRRCCGNSLPTFHHMVTTPVSAVDPKPRENINHMLDAGRSCDAICYLVGWLIGNPIHHRSIQRTISLRLHLPMINIDLAIIHVYIQYAHIDAIGASRSHVVSIVLLLLSPNLSFGFRRFGAPLAG